MLHSVLSRFGGEFIAGHSYPLLTSASAEDATAKNTVRDRITAYLRDKQQPVSCGELRQRFVAKLGFSHQTVMAVASADKILHYLNGILVHADTIAWDTEKQSQLIKVAEQYYAAQVRAGDVFARADLLLELHELDQPALAHGIDWTPILAAELLKKDKRVRVFGNRHNAFLINSNDHEIVSFPDFVALVLQKYFQGAASLTELSTFLREARVIAKAVTPKMLEGTDNLLVGEREIAVKGAC
jgi:hypothetical protein